MQAVKTDRKTNAVLTDAGYVLDRQNAIQWFAASFNNDALDEWCLKVALELRALDMQAGFMHQVTE